MVEGLVIFCKKYDEMKIEVMKSLSEGQIKKLSNLWKAYCSWGIFFNEMVSVKHHFMKAILEKLGSADASEDIKKFLL